eukprot:g5307.t1
MHDADDIVLSALALGFHKSRLGMTSVVAFRVVLHPGFWCHFTPLRIMFAISWPAAIVVLGLAYGLFHYVKKGANEAGNDWGSAHEAREYVDAVRYNYHLELLHANKEQEHTKIYRPSLLVLPKQIESDHSKLLFRFARKITSSSKGILVVGNVLEGTWDERVLAVVIIIMIIVIILVIISIIIIIIIIIIIMIIL